MTKFLSNVLEKLDEANEHKTSKEYKKLSPALKKAVDFIFSSVDTKSDLLSNLEKSISDAATKFKVREKELYDYFERENLEILGR